MDKREAQQDEYFYIAQNKAPVHCRKCDDLWFVTYIDQDGFDLERSLRGQAQQIIEPYCKYLFGDCNPAVCIRMKIDMIWQQYNDPEQMIKQIKKLL